MPTSIDSEALFGIDPRLLAYNEVVDERREAERRRSEPVRGDRLDPATDRVQDRLDP